MLRGDFGNWLQSVQVATDAGLAALGRRFGGLSLGVAGLFSKWG